MGILTRPQNMMRKLNLQRGFSVFELGDQMLSWKGYRQSAQLFYESIGCGVYDCVDGNGRGTVTADLNRPLSTWPWYVNQEFDLVTDFGTGEHVFDQKQVWETMHDLTKMGGHIVFDRPSSGYPGHCFYLLQPCVIAALAHANNYTIVTFEHGKGSRGDLIRGVMRKNGDDAFQVPQQGRYYKDLEAIMPASERSKGPDWKNRNIREHRVYLPRGDHPKYVADGSLEEGAAE